MMEWIESLPLLWSVALFWAMAAVRSTVTFSLGRGIAAGAEHTRLRRYLRGPVYERGMRFVDRWGPWAIPFCFMTIGLQTAVLASAGVARMRWVRFLPAMLLGSLIWGVIYGTVGMAVVWAVLRAFLGQPGVLVALLVLGAALFGLAWWRTDGFARLRASRRLRREHDAAAADAAATHPSSEK